MVIFMGIVMCVCVCLFYLCRCNPSPFTIEFHFSLGNDDSCKLTGWYLFIAIYIANKITEPDDFDD